MTAKSSGEGFVMIPNWIARTGFLNPAEYMLYGYLLGRANDAGKCWPSLSTIASETGISKRTVQRTLDRLEERKAIKRTPRRSKSGDRDSTSYTVTRYPYTRPDGLEGMAKMTTPYGHDGHTGVVTLANKVEPSRTRTTEVDDEVAPSAQHAKTKSKPPKMATPSQLRYLNDLTFLAGEEPPSEATIERWVNTLTHEAASARITDYLRSAGRGIDYAGPIEGEPAFERLSDEGKTFADAGMIPDTY